MEIKFVSNDFSDREVKSLLKESLSETKILRGAVAFWTIDYGYFRDALTDALNHEDSFYCVDVSMPTNFDALLKIHKKLTSKPKFYVHCKKTVEPKEHLLHSKIIVMDKFDGSTEIWVGSHNFTKSALDGLNIESSVVIILDSTESDSVLKKDVLKYLYDIKNFSNNKPFDESSYFYFMALQTSDYLNWITQYFQYLLGIVGAESIDYCRTIEIEGDDLANLTGSTIIVIGDNQKELAEMEKYGKNIIVHAHGNNGLEYFYRAELRARDKIDNKSSKQVEFGMRRVGNKNSHAFPIILDSAKIVTQQDLIQNGFYVNIEIKEHDFVDKNIQVYSNPNFKDLWFSENSKKRASDNLQKILVAMDFDRFEDEFLPKLIYEVSERRIVRNRADYGNIKTLHTEKRYEGQIMDELQYVSVFERRIYIMSSLIDYLR